MSFLTDVLEQIEFKLNIGDVLSIGVALFALMYTVISTKDNQRKSVLPYMSFEKISSSAKITGIGHDAKVEDHTSDYKVFVNKNNEMYGIEKWGENEISIIKNIVEIGPNAWSSGLPNFPKTIKIKNTGKNLATSFSLKVGKKDTYFKNIEVEEEKIISILLEDQKATFKIIINFKDIYGNRYKEKIEFYRGRMYLPVEIKRVKFSKTKTFFEKWKARFKICLNDKKDKKEISDNDNQNDNQNL